VALAQQHSKPLVCVLLHGAHWGSKQSTFQPYTAVLFVSFVLFCPKKTDHLPRQARDKQDIETADIAQNNSGVFGLLAGGAIALGGALEACDAIVDLWVPGQEAGSGLVSQLNRPLSVFINSCVCQDRLRTV
jgi:hypothetical protein